MLDAKEILDLRPDGWTKSHFFDIAKLAEETGEVAECMIKSAKTKEDLGEELSDVIVVAAVIALRVGIDLNIAHPKKQAKRVQKLLNRFHNLGRHPNVDLASSMTFGVKSHQESKCQNLGREYFAGHQNAKNWYSRKTVVSILTCTCTQKSIKKDLSSSNVPGVGKWKHGALPV